MSDHTRPKRTQSERTRLRKEQVIREAIRFFGQHGFHGARLADIAKAAGVTEPGLLHHYPSKVQLLMDVLAERDRVDRERLNPAERGEAGNLLASLQALVEYNQTVPGLVQLFTVLVAESIDEQHPGHQFFMQRYQNLRRQSLESLRQAQARGEIRNDIPAEDLLVLVFALMDGLQIQWLFEPDKINMVRLFEHFTRLVKEPSLNVSDNPAPPGQQVSSK
ncbi:MAG TPA: TetR/AcrR family transcriptional regulator [Anaerolineales bacterium]|nr:TetR/AcrR family transcriptional regulator [Anaerolineales bacterium]